ncbi:MAG TPA: gluconolactonase [Nannocystis exedens]|nr:gluconolactonase [Nannocystis exedens]
MRPIHWLLALLPLFACTGPSDDTGASTSFPTSHTATTTEVTSSTGGQISSSTGQMSSEAGTSTGSSTGTTETATGTETEGIDTRGPGFDCDALLEGPFEPIQVSSAFDGSEDIAFNGKGLLAGKRGDDLLLIDAMGVETVLAGGIPKAYGLRYRSDGTLIVALPGEGRLIEVSPSGDVSELLTDLGGPNGVYVDTLDRVWITEFGGNAVIRLGVDNTLTTIVQGADAAAANGIVYDPERELLFYTNYQAGLVRSVQFVGDEPGAPTVVTSIDGSPDGLVLDACGNLYVVDQGNSRLYRVLLDAEGAALGDPTLLAELTTNVANAQFGGAGFEPLALYLGGNPGVIYRLDLMVGGAPIPTVP